MIVKLIKIARQPGLPTKLRDDVYALTRYVVDADPWALAIADKDRVRSLSEYLHHAAELGVEPGEKAGHVGARNLITGTLREQQIEMLATASAAPRVEYPMVHIIVSWRSGEVPTTEQVDEAVDILLETAGLDRCAAIYAEHVNTETRHVHIAALRIDKATGAAAGSEWLVDDLHQAIALVEERQGWSPEPNALYYARGGAVFDAKARRWSAGQDGVEPPILDSEVMIRDPSGRRVRTRDRNAIAPAMLDQRDNILGALSASASWEEFHCRLYAAGLSYEKRGSGARIHLGEQSEKASRIARELSLTPLEKRWGAFVSSERGRNGPFEAYRVAHKAQLARLRADRRAAVASIRDWAEAMIKDLPRRSVTAVAEAVRGERDAAIRQVDEAFRAAIRSCTDARFIKLEEWKKAGAPPFPPEIASPAILLPSSPSREADWRAPASLRPETEKWQTRYYDAEDRLMLTDHGSIIIVHQPDIVDAVDAALLMAAERWGSIRVRGSDAFLQKCAERGAELGLSLVGPDGQPLVSASPAESRPEIGAEPDQPVEMPFVSHTEDPVRKATIRQLMSDLDDFGYVPVRRLADGNLEVEYEEDQFDPQPALHMAALFNEDEDIQALLRRQREAMLDFVERELCVWPVALVKDDVVKSFSGRKDRLGRAVFLAFDDPDFAMMLRRVEQARREREREREHERRATRDARRQFWPAAQFEQQRDRSDRFAAIEPEMPTLPPVRGGIGD
ncbi:hypothetical protein M527_23740 [Sphingobium indicum IP26]|uniref:Large polyvalent protein-associated domain-containing protein n=1 Tax=Sphingobium indicum F2 TaxID=1450518 RepID=A0A8E0WQM5_9SPHN|nr:relaxase/mobilization nuclease domain-containing protein [Sphingobium indicum]EPR15764.1 hypothetical protein M527_23740 [Sphingobium indicum IP26]KER35445.1 hypothetical protein AL00_15880 [Sphingobium indicum F2]